MSAAPLATPSKSPSARKANSLAVTLRSPPRPARRPARNGTTFRGSVAASQTQVKSVDRAARAFFAPLTTRMVDSRGPATASLERARAPGSERTERHVLDLGDRSEPGVPGPARRRFLAPVQHRVPGGVPGRDQLPRLPEPRRRGPLRGGLPPLARAQPGRGDVLLRLLGAVRAGLPPRRHRSAARHPGDEAVPRRVARGLRHPRRHAPDHAARGARRGRRRRARPGSPSPASWR